MTGYRAHPDRSERANLRLVTSAPGVEPVPDPRPELASVHDELRARSLHKLSDAANVISQLYDLVNNVHHAMEYHAREQNSDSADQELLASMAVMARELVEGGRFGGERLFMAPSRGPASSDPKLAAYHAGLRAFHEAQAPTEDPRLTRTLRDLSTELLGSGGLLARMDGVSNTRGYEAQEELSKLSVGVRKMLQAVVDCAAAIRSRPVEASTDHVC